MREVLRRNGYLPVLRGCVFETPWGPPLGLPQEQGVPAYARRVVVQCEVAAVCAAFGFDVAHVAYETEDGRPATAVEEVLRPPEEAFLERMLLEVLAAGRRDGFSESVDAAARELGVWEGFSLIKPYFEGS